MLDLKTHFQTSQIEEFLHGILSVLEPTGNKSGITSTLYKNRNLAKNSRLNY